jgi:glyoxylase-like metal-dependent hydrolase (beta-lactamase superfamily II)
VKVTALHTPGHTLDSVCLLVSDARRSGAPWFVVKGDTVYVGAVGRPDLAGKECEMASMIYDSPHKKLLGLPDEVEIYPGHQAGSACGAGLSGKPSSTIGFEHRWNQALSPSRDTDLTAVIPPRPTNTDAIVRSHLGQPA